MWAIRVYFIHEISRWCGSSSMIYLLHDIARWTLSEDQFDSNCSTATTDEVSWAQCSRPSLFWIHGDRTEESYVSGKSQVEWYHFIFVNLWLTFPEMVSWNLICQKPLMFQRSNLLVQSLRNKYIKVLLKAMKNVTGTSSIIFGQPEH